MIISDKRGEKVSHIKLSPRIAWLDLYSNNNFFKGVALTYRIVIHKYPVSGWFSKGLPKETQTFQELNILIQQIKLPPGAFPFRLIKGQSHEFLDSRFGKTDLFIQTDRINLAAFQFQVQLVF